ncbi:MAG: hypothetical protein AB8H80_15155 [Planctomycetota bacterium]
MAAALTCFVAAGLAADCAAQSSSEIHVRAYEKKRREERLATGQRHVDLGWSIKDKGLITQATYQFVLAVELSHREHGGASTVLNIVRQYGDAFWKKRRKKPRKGALKAYEKKAARLVEQDQKGQVELARKAWKAKLVDETKEHLRTAMEFGAVAVIEKKRGEEEGAGRAKIGRFQLDASLLPWLLELTLEGANGERRMDPAKVLAGAATSGGQARARSLPKLEGFAEARSDQLIVRSNLSPDTEFAVEIATELHELGSALWEPLRDRLSGAPTRPLTVVVFAKRSDYDAYLVARGHADIKSAGLCDYGARQTLLCAEGLDESSRNALLLHELTHLFFFESSPIAMPDWYAEGLAETFGGQGTFAWSSGKKSQSLSVGGMLERTQLDAIQKQPMTLQQVLAGNAIHLWRDDRDAARRFYAMSWALQRWLVSGEHRWRKRFEAWEAKCRGSLLGRTSTRGFGSPQAATAAFLKEFGADLDAMQKVFSAYLQTL